VLVGLPAVVLIHSLIVHQTLLGNYPMIARWQMHRYLLRQSLSFFSDEFAGRVATKVMQTSLAVREAVMTLLDVFVYVLVYFLAMIGMVASADWRLVLPLLFWLAAYTALIMYFVPRTQADLNRAGGRTLADDRAGGGQLHQHLDGEVVLPCRARGDLCAAKVWTCFWKPCTGKCGWSPFFSR
jgi:ABC-type multidrug transport system fused ATPase/permease subunit